MNPKRKQRLYLTVFLFFIAGGVTTLLIQISGENMNMFYPPEDVVSGKAPVGERLRAGGMDNASEHVRVRRHQLVRLEDPPPRVPWDSMGLYSAFGKAVCLVVAPQVD